MMLRKPLTLTHDETHVPSSIVEGTGPRQPPNIVIHSSNRLRSDASFQAVPGSTSDLIDTSARATVAAPPQGPKAEPRSHIPGCGEAINADLGPGLRQLLRHVDDLRGLRLWCVDFLRHVGGDESTDFAVDAREDAQHLAAEGLGRHVDRDVGR